MWHLTPLVVWNPVCVGWHPDFSYGTVVLVLLVIVFLACISRVLWARDACVSRSDGPAGNRRDDPLPEQIRSAVEIYISRTSNDVVSALKRVEDELRISIQQFRNDADKLSTLLIKIQRGIDELKRHESPDQAMQSKPPAAYVASANHVRKRKKGVQVPPGPFPEEKVIAAAVPATGAPLSEPQPASGSGGDISRIADVWSRIETEDAAAQMRASDYVSRFREEAERSGGDSVAVTAVDGGDFIALRIRDADEYLLLPRAVMARPGETYLNRLNKLYIVPEPWRAGDRWRRLKKPARVPRTVVESLLTNDCALVVAVDTCDVTKGELVLV